MGVPKIPQSQMELRPIWVDTRVAQELGLSDHQIIQATVVLQDKSVRLWLKDFSFEIPYTWNVKPGDMPFVSVRAMPGAWSIQLQSNPLGPTAPNVPQAQTNALGAAGAGLVHGANVPHFGLERRECGGQRSSAHQFSSAFGLQAFDVAAATLGF